jgi:ABC-2 type transport system permease protein
MEHKDATVKGSVKRVLLVVLLAVVLLPSYFLYGLLISYLSELFAVINQQGVVFAILNLLLSVLMFVFGVTYVFANLFAAKDIDMLLTLPVRSSSIISSKLLMIVIGEEIFAALLLLPALWFLRPSEGALFYWIYGVVMTLACPLIPLSIGAILSMVFVRIFGVRVNTDKIQIFVIAVTMLISVGASIISNRIGFMIGSGMNGEVDQMALVGQILEDNTFLINAATKAYYPALFFTKALLAPASFEGFLNFFLYSGVSLLLFIVAVMVGDATYIKAVMSGATGKARKKKMSERQLSASLGATSKTLAIAKTDLKILLRTPVFALNAFAMVVVVPLILVVYGFMFDEETMAVLLEVYRRADRGVVNLYAAISVMFLLDMTSIAGSTFSREGSAHWINQVTPVTAAQQFVGRTLTSYVVNAATVLITLAMVSIKFPIRVLDFAGLACLVFSGTVPSTLFAILVDLRRPKLNWDNPSRAMKQNMNALIGMAFSLLLVAILGVGTYTMLDLTIPPLMVGVIIFAFNALASVAFGALFLNRYSAWMADK